MRFAIIGNGLVANVAMASVEFAAEQGWISCPDEVSPGWAWDGSTFTEPTITQEVPEAITMRQARLALLGAGMLGAVDAAINSLPSPMKEAAQIEWDYASQIRRDSQLIAHLAPGIGLTDAQIDGLFIAGAAL